MGNIRTMEIRELSTEQLVQMALRYRGVLN